MNKKQSILLSGVMILTLFLTACGAASQEPTVAAPTATITNAPVTITGRVTNLPEVLPFMQDNSTLQLVRVSDDGKGSFVFPESGGIYVESDLAAIPLPGEDGLFEFRLASLDPGIYFISAQRFTPPNGTQFNAMVIAGNPADPQSIITFEMPADAVLPYKLEMGPVAIVLP
jgi:hypothetical protein